MIGTAVIEEQHSGGKRGGSSDPPIKSPVTKKAPVATKPLKKTSGGGATKSPAHPATDPTTWHSRLSSKEKDAVLDYTTSKHIELNKSLREGGKLTAEQKKMVDSIDSALEKSVTTRDHTLYENQKYYRAADNPVVNSYVLNQAIKDKKHEGFEFTENAYSSTSLDFMVAKGFQRSATSRLFVIHAPAGYKMADVSQISNFSNEKEVLVARGTTYRIKNIEKVKYTVTDHKGKKIVKKAEVVNMEIVGQK